jgi:hypothetical protein
MPPPDALREALRARVLPAAPDPLAAAAARAVAERGGPAVRASVFFGSRKTRARPDPYSAWDLFVIVSGYSDFYRALRAAGAWRRSPGTAAALNAVMPPNSLALRAPNPEGGPDLLVKCAVVSSADFARETSARHRDHFLLGRLFQPTEIAHAADEAAREEALDGLVRAARLTYTWGRPFLPDRFDVTAYCRTLLRVSYSAEIRPEPAGRAEALWLAQRDALRPVYEVLLSELRAAGELLEPEPGVYALAHPTSAGERWRLSAYFRFSLVRATARWAKYMVTFDDWLEFILRKARRHTGEDIVLTPRERRLPLVFLWPRVVRYLRHKDARGTPPR